MEAGKEHAKNKGGRPGKVVKRDKLLGVKCTKVEAFLIKVKAEKIPLTVSEYLRELGLNGKIDMRKKALPKEVLQLTGTLNHLAANLNQVAHKRNRGEELNAIERATLMVLSAEVKELAKTFKAALT